jgi:DNA-binding CsgD family transcriptional regulator
MGRRPTPDGHLSPAEARVVAEYARGGTSADVAARLFLEPTTVRTHTKTARRRLRATSNVHLLALAIAAGDIPADVATGTAAPRDH